MHYGATLERRRLWIPALPHFARPAGMTPGFCQYDKLRGQVVVMPHPDALADLLSGEGPVAGYFSSEPFTEIALADGRVHKVLGGADIVDGKAMFLILGATKGYVDAHPTVPEAVIKAMDEAARIINDDPRRAAAIYSPTSRRRHSTLVRQSQSLAIPRRRSAARSRALRRSPNSWAPRRAQNAAGRISSHRRS